jgi:hypothetical protein
VKIARAALQRAAARYVAAAIRAFAAAMRDARIALPKHTSACSVADIQRQVYG